MQQPSQSLGTLLGKGTLYRVGARGAFVQAGKPPLVEGMDGTEDCLVIAAKRGSNLRCSLALATRQHYLAAPQHKGIGRAQSFL